MKRIKLLSVMFLAFVAMLSFNACGDDKDDDGTKTGNGKTNTENSSDPGKDQQQAISAAVGTWETVAVKTEGGMFIQVNSTDSSVYSMWHRFVFGADGSFNGYSVNYKGSASLRGRIEHTMVAKFSYNEKDMIVTLSDLVQGYHEVIKYLEGKSVQKTTQQIKLDTFTKDEMSFSFQDSTGYVTFIMNKVSTDINVPPVNPNDSTAVPPVNPNDSTAVPPVNPNDSINVNPVIPNDSANNQMATTAQMLIGKWGTTNIRGNAVGNDSTVIDTWDNYPSKNDVNTGKTSLKYEEYVFTKDGVFERWAFDDNRQFNLIFSGTYAVDGNWVTVLVGDMRFGITISRITDTSMVFIRQAYEEDFKTKDGKNVPAIVTDIITTTRIDVTR